MMEIIVREKLYMMNGGRSGVMTSTGLEDRDPRRLRLSVRRSAQPTMTQE